MSHELGRPVRFIDSTIQHEEIDRLLVEGETVTGNDGKPMRVYPMSREIAERLGVSPSWISKYARAHRCFERRAELQSQVQAKAHAELVREEGKRLAFDTERMLKICDKLMEKYEEAIDERGVGNFTAADLNTVARLRRFLQGDADSRQEVKNGVTLEAMQAAHLQLLKMINGATPEEAGVENDDSLLESGKNEEVESKVDLEIDP